MFWGVIRLSGTAGNLGLSMGFGLLSTKKIYIYV